MDHVTVHVVIVAAILSAGVLLLIALVGFGIRAIRREITNVAGSLKMHAESGAHFRDMTRNKFQEIEHRMTAVESDRVRVEESVKDLKHSTNLLWDISRNIQATQKALDVQIASLMRWTDRHEDNEKR